MVMRLLVSSGFQAGVTNSFHLINTIRTSTSILTTEVRKVVRAGANDRVLEALYPIPSGASGQNLRAFSNQTNTQHEHALATLWLFTVIGLYEVWAAELPIAGAEVNCQFPSKGYNVLSTKAGVGAAINALQPSVLFGTVYGAAVASDPRMINHARLDDTLAVYRLFKECRNSLAHAGGEADDRVERWGIDVQARAADLFVDAQGGRAVAPRFVQGDEVMINLDQVRAFVSVLFRIVFTVDASILISTIGESEISRRWVSQYGREPIRVERRKLHKGSWIRARFAEIGVPVPPAPAHLVPYLISSHLVREII